MKRITALLLAILILSTVISFARAEDTTVKVTFTLKDQFGDAVDCADLRIARRNSNKVIKTVTTNSRGKATVKLAPGKYQVNGTALPDGYWWESVADTKGSPVKQFTVGEKSLTVGLTCVSRTEQVTITTKDIHTGENLGKVGLQIYDGDGKKVLATRTGAKGKKTIALKPGNYQIGAVQVPEGYTGLRIVPVKVKEGKKASWTVQVYPQFTCRVKVLDSRGNPVSGAKVWIRTVHAVTNSKGIATVKNVTYGEWDVAVWAKLNGEEYVPYSKKKALKTGAGETIRWTIRLPDESKWMTKPEPEV